MTKPHRDVVWGFLAPITPVAPLLYLLSSISRLKETAQSMWRDSATRYTLILLALSSAISTVIAPDRLAAIGGVLALYLFILFVAYGVWGIERPLCFLRALVIGAGFLGLIVVLARLLRLEFSLFGVPILTEFSSHNARGNVLGMANNGLSALLEPGVAGGIGLAILDRRRRWLLVVCALLSAAGVFITLSRGGMVGMTASLIVLLVLTAKYLRRYWKVTTAIVVVAALVLATLIAVMPGLAERIVSIVHIEENIQRVRIWIGTLRMIQAHPLFGSGPANFGKVYPEFRLAEEWEHARSPHNLYLYVLSGWGIVGFTVFYGYLARVAILPFQRHPSPYRTVALAMIASFWVHVLVNDLYLPHIPLIMGCIANSRLNDHPSIEDERT